MVITLPSMRFLSSLEPFYLHFPAYGKDDIVNILALQPKSIFKLDEDEEYTPEMAEEDSWLWTQCCSAVWDTLGKYAARDIYEMRDILEKVWDPLIQPILENEYGIRDFAKLFNRLKTEKLRNREDSFVSKRITPEASSDIAAMNRGFLSDR